MPLFQFWNIFDLLTSRTETKAWWPPAFKSNFNIIFYSEKLTSFYLVLQLKELFCERNHIKHLNKILEKYLRKSFFLVKLGVLRMNSFTSVFQDFR